VKKLIAKIFHPAHGAAHLTYFALVAIEGHGFYAAAAGSLFLITIVGFFLGEDS
jgi:hypothetical protein